MPDDFGFDKRSKILLRKKNRKGSSRRPGASSSSASSSSSSSASGRDRNALNDTQDTIGDAMGFQTPTNKRKMPIAKHDDQDMSVQRTTKKTKKQKVPSYPPPEQQSINGGERAIGTKIKNMDKRTFQIGKNINFEENEIVVIPRSHEKLVYGRVQKLNKKADTVKVIVGEYFKVLPKIAVGKLDVGDVTKETSTKRMMLGVEHIHEHLKGKVERLKCEHCKEKLSKSSYCVENEMCRYVMVHQARRLYQVIDETLKLEKKNEKKKDRATGKNVKLEASVNRYKEENKKLKERSKKECGKLIAEIEKLRTQNERIKRKHERLRKKISELLDEDQETDGEDEDENGNKDSEDDNLEETVECVAEPARNKPLSRRRSSTPPRDPRVSKRARGRGGFNKRVTAG